MENLLPGGDTVSAFKPDKYENERFNLKLLANGKVHLRFVHCTASRGKLVQNRAFAITRLFSRGSASPEVRGVLEALVRALNSEVSYIKATHLEDVLRQLFFTRLHKAPSAVLNRGLLSAEIEDCLSPALAEARAMREIFSRAAGERGGDKLQAQDMVSLWTFRETVAKARLAILLGVHPTLIVKGTSGSYFVRDRESRMIAVFKPRSEEPYAFGNPKWPKHLQRICCPCMFGRDCLVLNCGYLSEAGASVVDRALGTNLVPRTEVVELSSPVFNNILQRSLDNVPIRIGAKVLPVKTGSFQTFVHGFVDAGSVIRDFKKTPLGAAARASFIEQFQRLVILDFVIRNTDRNPDNWLVKVERPAGVETVTIAAIDNGLAFPIRHPNGARKFPFQWAALDFAAERFIEKVLPIAARLEDRVGLEDIMAQLYLLFKLDPGFSETEFEGQMGVFLGQCRTLAGVIRSGGCPRDLASAPEVMASVSIKDLAPALARITNAGVLDMVSHRLMPGYDGTANTPAVVSHVIAPNTAASPQPTPAPQLAASLSGDYTTYDSSEESDEFHTCRETSTRR